MIELRLALRACWFYRRRNALVMAALVTVLVMPTGLELVFREGSALLLSRAASTPLVLVAPGSAVDQVLAALHFQGTRMVVTQGEVDALADAQLAEVIPIHARFRAQGAPVVGTTIDYFRRRGLRLERGRSFALLGEAVVGSRVARTLRLGPGYTVRTDAESPFDLTATLPLELEVTGVLMPTAGPDDDAIFVDLKTSWIIQGLGHGHGETDPTNPVPPAHQRITAANIQSFHFHGDRRSYPLTAGLVWPSDPKSHAILRARYDDERDGTLQLVEPLEVMNRVLQKALRFRSLLLAASGLVAFASLGLLALVLSLSLSLRRKELEALARIGVSRASINRLLSIELLLLVVPSVLAAWAVVLLLTASAGSLWLAVLGD